MGYYKEETPDELVLGNSLEEYAFNIFEYEKARSGSDYFNRTLDTDNSSDKRSTFKKANRQSTFEIFIIPEVTNEEEYSNCMNEGRSREMSSQNTSSDNIRSSSFDKVKRYFKESKRFKPFDADEEGKEKMKNHSLELSGHREGSERVDKSTLTDNTESMARERTFEDKSSFKDDSFKKMIDDQVNKYEKTHEKGFFLSKPTRFDAHKLEESQQMDDSCEAPVKDLSYDFFKEPSSQNDRSKHKTSDASDIGINSSEHRTGSFRLNDSDNPRFVDLGKFNSLDSSKNSETPRQIGKKHATHSTSLGPKISADGSHI